MDTGLLNIHQILITFKIPSFACKSPLMGSIWIFSVLVCVCVCVSLFKPNLSVKGALDDGIKAARINLHDEWVIERSCDVSFPFLFFFSASVSCSPQPGGQGRRAQTARRQRRRCGGETPTATRCATPAACTLNCTM